MQEVYWGWSAIHAGEGSEEQGQAEGEVNCNAVTQRPLWNPQGALELEWPPGLS